MVMEKGVRAKADSGHVVAPAVADVSEIPLTPRERRIVKLLAAGYTDEAAARELEISRRTVCYAVRGLMVRMGAGSRFQLAWLLQSLAHSDRSSRSPGGRAGITRPPGRQGHT
ncbi:helix-turn-helix transcriptional regulator [Micromonospora parva]|uniref:helix-turn-helix domain-containing protein n=1 Tax=Micromonospora parva TaxID=1464048 RepID=UPI0033CBDD1D